VTDHAALPAYFPCFVCQASMPLNFDVCGACGSGLDVWERREAAGLPADPDDPISRLACALGAMPNPRLLRSLEAMDSVALELLTNMVESATGAAQWTDPGGRDGGTDPDTDPDTDTDP
jgi:hypothetical protein